MKKRRRTLLEFVDSTEARGRQVFLRDPTIQALGMSKTGFKRAADRLKQKKRIVGTKTGFYVIVPLQYRTVGAPPAAWFIDDLMKFLGKPYYVGILSAAEIHGAAHQRPQAFQVVTNSPTRSLRLGGIRIEFFTRKRLPDMPVQEVKTPTGFIHVSTPETTAIDVVRYYAAAGHLDNVATVLVELAEVLDAKKLTKAAVAGGEVSTAQRLGYLLDQYAAKRLTPHLASWVHRKNSYPVLLSTEGTTKAPKLNKKWNVFVNIEIEPDV